MKEKLFEIADSEREHIKSRLRDFLKNKPGILFAYLHGSFLTAERFHDIDTAIYLENIPLSPLELELQLEAELGEAVHYPVDVRILNNSTLSFKYNAIKDGEVIVVNNDDLRAEFEESVISNYVDFAPFRKIYLQEALGLGL